MALTLTGWTAFQWIEDEKNAGDQWEGELKRISSDRIVLLQNWLADRRDDAVDLTNRSFVQQLFGEDGGLLESTSTRARVDQFALTYGYSGMIVMDARGQVKARSTRLAVSPGQLTLMMARAQSVCGAVLDVLPGSEKRPVFVALAPVLPVSDRSCVAPNLRGYVAIEANADAELFSRLHMDLPPPGVTVMLFHQAPAGTALLLHSARRDHDGAETAPSEMEQRLSAQAFAWERGFHRIKVDGKELWYSAETIAPVGWVMVAYVERDFALAEVDRDHRLLLLFDVLFMAIVAAAAAAVHLRSRTRSLQEELEQQRVVAGLRAYARRIVETSPVGLVVLNADWEVVTANQAFCRMAGVAERDVQALPVDTWIDVSQYVVRAPGQSNGAGSETAMLRPRQGAAKPVALTVSDLAAEEGADGRYLLTMEDLSQRRQLEERYRLLFENNMAAIVQTRLDGEWGGETDGVIVDCNDAFARLMGVEGRQSLLSERIQQFYRSPAERERFLGEVRRGGQITGYELELKRRDGASVWALVSATLLASEDGPPMMQATLVDITQRRLAQQTVEKQARLLDLTRDGVIVRDLDGTIRFWNEGAHLMYGWSGAEALGQPSQSLLQTEFPEKLERMQDELLASGYWAGDLRQQRKDGTAMDVASRWVLQRNESGAPQRVLETNTDMTERRAAEKALVDSNRRIVEIFDSITEGFYALDTEWRFTFVNREAERMLRVSAGELLGHKIWDMMPGCWGGPFHQNYDRALKEGVKVEFEEFSPAVGAWIEVRAYPSPSGLSVYFRDVSERRHLEARLRQAEKMDAVGRLAGGIAHDFNNLLNVIGGYSELLAQNLQDDPKLGRYAQEITASALRAGALTRQLLAFGRQQRLTPQVLNINFTMRDLEPLLKRMVGEDIDLVMVPDRELGNIQADPTQIEQVIVNLAANARDAMPGGGKLLMETSNLDLDEPLQDDQIHLQPGRYVLLSVSDTGVGMDTAVRRRIFEPFFTTKEIGRGTGLGLATVDGVVQQSGGVIWVYSEPGRGTTFKIYLPRVEGQAATAAGERAPELPVPGGHESILLVEDEEALRSLTREILERYGYRVVTAANGEEALQMLAEAGPFDLVVTDVVMPGMGGSELAERIRDTFPRIRILFMSGYTGRAMLRQGRLRAGSHFLAKPFTGTRLARAVRESLEEPLEPKVTEWLTQAS